MSPSDLLLSQVHTIIDALGKSTSKIMKPKAMGQVRKKDDEEKDSDDDDQKQLSSQMSNALRIVNASL